MRENATIQDQLRLPLSVAFEVAMQGIRIRFGRSLVTLTGVVLGIAFLMSVLSAQVVKQGVSHEAELRNEVRRMQAFLVAETGPLKDRRLGVLQVGAMDEREVRLVRAVQREGLSGLSWARASEQIPLDSAAVGSVQTVAVDEVATDGAAVLVMGQGTVPPLDWESLLSRARDRVVCVSREEHQIDSQGAFPVVSIARELRPEEVEQAALEARQTQFRSLWMTVIALVVTLISISNSLLMSATERFREIGTMKCLGALSSFIRQLFLIESSLIGLVGGVLGAILGPIIAVAAYGITFSFPLVLSSLNVGQVALYAVPSVLAGIVLSVVAALYPANFAARMVPGAALRTNI